MKYIRHHDRKDVTLASETGLPPFQEVSTNRVSPAENFVRGFYIRAGQLVIGVVASANGPVLFFNNSQFILDPTSFDLRVTKAAAGNTFLASRNGGKLLEVLYEPPDYVGIDSWSDTEMVDFFDWLSKASRDPAFYRFYTLEALR